MKRKWTMLLAGASTVVLALQLIRLSIPAPAERREVDAPPEATKVLRTSCYSCHSNQRKLAWFDDVVPAYWLVRHDVLRARAHLNFSALGMNPKPAQRAALCEAVNMAQFGAMPLPSFTALHPEARVNPADLNELKAFLAPWGDLPPELSEPAKLIAPISAEPVVSSLDFDPQLTDWRLLSVTDRGDNNSLRFILGNDKAVKAMREGNTKVWPDGARFGKIGWQQRRNADVG